MKKNKLSKLTVAHVQISLIIILISSVLTSFYQGWQNFNILSFLTFFLISLMFATPIILGVYLGYVLIAAKIHFSKIFALLSIIIGAWIIPQISYWATFKASEPNWAFLLFKFMVINNILLLIANEIFLFVNLIKIKK